MTSSHPPGLAGPSKHPNASIWPVQLRDKDVRCSTTWTISKRPSYVPLHQLDFEDVSYFLDFDLLAALYRPRLSSHGPHHAGSKRKRSPSHRSVGGVSDQIRKKPRWAPTATAIHSTTEWADLISTCCLFHIKAREARDSDIILELKQMQQDASTSQPTRMDDLEVSVMSSSSSRLDDSIIGYDLHLRDRGTGNLVAVLPVLAHDEASSEHHSHAGKLTNGEWLASLSFLLTKGALAATFALEAVQPPIDYPVDRITAGSLFLKLVIQVQVPVSRDAAGLLAGDRMLHMARVVRFADLTPELDGTSSRSQAVDTSLVYQNLRPASVDAPDAIQPAELGSTLLPFQKRSTAFVLGREGMALASTDGLVQSERVMGHDGYSDLGLWWEQVGVDLYYNWIEARFVRDPKLTLLSDCKGAMLAEEMGLGKTVEAVALMLLNPDPDASSRAGWYDERNEIDVVPTKTTLIVAPETLRAQWIEEIDRHTPSLTVYSFLGRTQAEADVPDGMTWEEWARRFDVMILSYATLARELSTAKSAPTRSRRHERKYERPRSPLVRLHFHRVLMDEVQMIGSSNAAETVSMISRSSSIAVSGTPVKKIDDLKSCFRFLRVPGYLASPSEWQAILHPLLSSALARVLRIIGTRHTKMQVASEMLLPKQTRSVIPIDFTSIEATFYSDVWKEALNEIGYNQDGDSQTPIQQADIAKMRQHLLLLRQACTHPQVALQFRGGVVGSKNLRSIDEVLELMIDSTRTELHNARSHWFDRRIHRNILALYRRSEDQRILSASQLNDIEREIALDIAGMEQEIRDAASSGPLYRFTEHELELEELVKARQRRPNARSPDAKQEDDDETALEALVEDPEVYRALLEKRKARATHVSHLKALLRSLLMKLHRLLQFVGNLYYQRGEFLEEQEKSAAARNGQVTPLLGNAEPDKVKLEDDFNAESASLAVSPPVLEVQSKRVESDDTGKQASTETELKPALSSARQSLKDNEDAAYAKAEKVRQRLLAEAVEKVQGAISRLNRDQVQLDADSLQVSKDLFELGGGILSTDSYARLAGNVTLLNDHAKVLFDWRKSIITRLVRAVNRDVSLEREDDDQYQDNLDTQAEAEVLLEMYRPLLAEREKILKGNVAVGATARPQLFKELEDAVRLARQNDLRGTVPDEGIDAELLQVQKRQLADFKKLDEERRSVSLPHQSQSFHDTAEYLKGLRDNSLSGEEATLARQAHLEARRIISEQSKHLDKLRNEEKLLLTSLFNARTQYFKEIQVLSDTVRDPVFADLENSIKATQKEEIETVSKVDELERRLRYLLHLQMVQAADQLDEETKRCNICTDPIEIGILTNRCGHVCCESCWKEWQSQGHRTCVMCQTRVLPTEVHRIIYSSARTPARHGRVATSGQGRKASETESTDDAKAPLAVQYHELDDSLRSVLNRVAIQGRFGSKIDHVAKHVRHIINQTGEKSLIFSSFGRGLDVVAQSLTANGIRFVRLTGAGKAGGEAAKIFRSDPSIHVMLLHSEAQSSGLNLLAASHIHILEPLVNTSLELQALGRVHRIGQTKETSVWCYYVNDTVEERILALSAYKGQSLYMQGRHTSLSDGPNTLEAGVASSSKATAEHSRQGEKKRSLVGKGKLVGGAGAMRGDITSNSTELLACFFARYLALLGEVQTSSPRPAVDAATDGPSNKTGTPKVEEPTLAVGTSGGEVEEDELAKLRKARLAALERRQFHPPS